MRLERWSLHSVVAAYTVLLNFALLGFAWLLFAMHGILFQDLTAFVGTVGPVLAALSTTVVRYVIVSQGLDRSDRRQRGPLYVVFMFSLPTAFALAMASVLLAKAYNWGITTPEQYRLALTTTQSSFGVYAGMMVSSLFGEPRPDAATSEAAAPTPAVTS